MKLWVFGDSFSTPQAHMKDMRRSGGAPEFAPLDKTWTSIVSETLIDSAEHENWSVQGCSNEYIWKCLTHTYNDIKKNDYVIVQLTSSFRKWFWLDRPHLANHFNTKFIEGENASKKEIKAIEMFQRYLNPEFLNDSNYLMTVCAVQHIASRLDGKAKVLILPGFHPINGVTGNLADASAGEFDSIESRTAYYKKTSDQRYNHFSSDNHKILADKIIRFFTKFEQVDLTKDFKTNIFNKDTVAKIDYQNIL